MELNLQPYSLTRPYKVEWSVASMPPEPLDIIKSKTTKKFLRNHLADFLKDYNLNVTVKPITESDFLEWFEYYKEKMLENDFQIMATPSWFQDKKAIGWELFGIYIHQGDTLLGAGIVSATPENKYTINFKASDKTDFSNYRNASLGTIIEYYFLTFAYEKKAAGITSGKSRNAFGVINKLGYLNFKTRFGYTPMLVAEEAQYQTVEALEHEPVCFYAYQNPEQPLHLYVYNHKQPLTDSLKEILNYVDYEVLE